MRISLSHLVALAIALPACNVAASSSPSHELPTPAPDAVLVLGSLHGLHERETSFTHGDLYRVLEAADPDILLVETRPDELLDRTATPGRPEYPKVVWPWLKNRPSVRVEAMEPGGEIFKAMTSAAGAKYARFEAKQPRAYAEVQRLQGVLTLALLDHWKHPADAHDQTTRDLTRASVLVEQALGGPGADQGQADWDGYMVARAKAVISANPGKRIVALASYRNEAAFRAALAGNARWVDAETWLRGVQLKRPE